MIITMTLAEILDRCNDWDYFCEQEGWSVWAVNEGGGDIDVALSEQQCYKYGVLRSEDA